MIHLDEENTVELEIEALLMQFQSRYPKHRLTLQQEQMISIAFKAGVKFANKKEVIS